MIFVYIVNTLFVWRMKIIAISSLRLEAHVIKALFFNHSIADCAVVYLILFRQATLNPLKNKKIIRPVTSKPHRLGILIRYPQ